MILQVSYLGILISKNQLASESGEEHGNKKEFLTFARVLSCLPFSNLLDHPTKQ